MPKTATKRTTKRHAASSGAHAFWSGTISFGLVSIPVHLFPANHSSGDSLRLLGPDGTPLQRRYYCPAHDRDIHPEHIVRGYELEDGKYVIVRDEELESLEPRKSHVIELRQFVARAQISPAYFERAYVLTPNGEPIKAYHLLATAMEETDQTGIATFVMRDREYLVAILAEGGVLRAETLRFHDEIRTPKEIGLPDKPRLNKSLVSKFERAIHKLAAHKLPEASLQDERADQLRKLAERKRKRGVDVVELQEHEAAPEQDEDESDGGDLLEAIRRSLQGSTERAKHNGHAKQNGHARQNGRVKSSGNAKQNGQAKKNGTHRSR